MTVRDLFVYVDNDRQCGNRLGYAVQIARCFGANLHGVYVRRQMGIPSYAEVQIPKDVLAEAERSLAQMAASASAAFSQAVDGTSLQTGYRELRGTLPDVLSASLRYADLAVLPQRHPEDADLNTHYNPAPLMFQTGRPVLIVPHGGTLEFPARRAVVAWDGGAASARALHDALPLLAKAEQVVVVSVGKRASASLDDNDLGAHLARHGLDVELRNVEAADSDAHRVVMKVAADTGSGLLVMGGYGHTRVRELVLGGMTRDVLSGMTAPVLMSH